ncbi:hydrogenase expression/formation C-terminal domain-containing protein [Kaarinaea lacus]
MTSPFSEIPVTVEQGERTSPPSAQVKALLQELLDMLQVLVETGDHNYIDIRSLPLMPGELDSLKQILGTGEVEATVNALGPTMIRETKIPGIWWVTHKNSNNEVLSEFIEVTTLPEILVTQNHDLHESPEQLKRYLEELGVN